MTESRSPQSAKIRKAAYDQVMKLDRAKVTPDKELPSDAVDALSELARLAAELSSVRGSLATGQEQGAIARPALPCERENTWWNSFKWLLGFRDPWCECMNREYDGADWC
jgi:hypothetical protein